MDIFFTEVLSSFHAPSSDTKLVIFADETVRESKLSVKKHLLLCSEYAANYRVFLLSGLIEHNENLCMCLLNPAGKIVCRQAAVHLAPAMQWKLQPADEISVVHTELGDIFLCVDADIFHSELVRAAALKGADLILSVQHIDPAEDKPERLTCSVWNAAQSNNLYVVNLSGNSCTVACPAPLTRNQDGYLVRRTACVPTRFALNLPRLDEITSHFQILEHINTELISHYAEELGR